MTVQIQKNAVSRLASGIRLIPVCSHGERSDKKTASHPVTFERAAREWLNTRSGIVKESTIAHYATVLENHLLPELGNVLLKEFVICLPVPRIKQKW